MRRPATTRRIPHDRRDDNPRDCNIVVTLMSPEAPHLARTERSHSLLKSSLSRISAIWRGQDGRRRERRQERGERRKCVKWSDEGIKEWRSVTVTDRKSTRLNSSH